jgi:Predicted Zn peptidase
MLEGEQSAIVEAWRFQQEAGISEIPVSIEKYLRAANAEVKVRYDLKNDEAGQVFQFGDRTIIIVNGNHSSERQRFTILHELAHIRLGLPSKHGSSTSVSDLLSYSRRPKEEVLCDVFAAECLLPNRFFRPDVRKSTCSFQSVQQLAERYEASLTATGSRYATYSDEPCAWILADDQRIRFVASSASLRNARFFVRIGIEIPKRSVLGRLARGDSTVRPLVAEAVAAYVWVDNPLRGISEFEETAVLQPSLNQGLALLVAEPIEDERQARDFDWENEEEDGLLREIDGHLKFPSHRRR